MFIHEYQSKSILRDYGIPVPNGSVASTGVDALRVAKHMGGDRWVVKAQVLAGGRGKAGGVKLTSELNEIYDIASTMLGMTLVTKQTGPEGKVVRRVLVEEATDIAREVYLSFLVDRDNETHVVIASAEGGTEIEEVAEKNPDAIIREDVGPAVGFGQYQGRKIARKLGFEGKLINQFASIMEKLYNVFRDTDASLLEVNPLVVTGGNEIVCLDTKMSIDDNALYRHPRLEDMRDYNDMDPQEVHAAIHDLSYVSLDGNIGCLVNGAGLAMATMDIIKAYGGEPANFLDVGGGADVDKVREAFRIILSDDKVKGILVNIFGGIMRCDVIAEGIVKAAKQVTLNVPLIVRLEGTNVEEGKRILAESEVNVLSADSMAEAAELAVKCAGGNCSGGAA